MDLDPILPPEIEREIFLFAAQVYCGCAPRLCLVAARVREWVQPFMPGCIVLRASELPGLNHDDSEVPRLPDEVERELFRSAIFHCDCGDADLRLTPHCSSVQKIDAQLGYLAVEAFDAIKSPTLSLYSCAQFSNVRSLSIRMPPGGIYIYSPWTSFPALTHLFLDQFAANEIKSMDRHHTLPSNLTILVTLRHPFTAKSSVFLEGLLAFSPKIVAFGFIPSHDRKFRPKSIEKRFRQYLTQEQNETIFFYTFGIEDANILASQLEPNHFPWLEKQWKLIEERNEPRVKNNVAAGLGRLTRLRGIFR